ncbi:hypothetical protein [Rhodohalobacter sp.]|uniref:hypothetical protein n=1 Tax=Rhodohalobacter sp. TaxID=1974210 RepID=UPI002ACEE61F|nr:hypothetical protein [Rhodohalobacter sp.]MDZ7758372.1 hypothetical protein [Rhodohalobacter sp.]
MADLFKLIYEHDIRLDQLRERQLDRDSQEVSGSIEDFLKPDPTYSKFYFSGTVLNKKEFGLNCLSHYDEWIDRFSEALMEYQVFRDEDQVSIKDGIEGSKMGEPLILSKSYKNSWTDQDLKLDYNSNVGHKKSGLANVLEGDDLVLYKEPAHNGYDLHLFSKQNIYRPFFEQFKKMVSDEFRFFSINGKRVRSERKFYFETWTLDRPPHGAEEVFKDTVL